MKKSRKTKPRGDFVALSALDSRPDAIRKAYLYIMLTGILCAFISIVATQGDSLQAIRFNAPNDSFMDFFNPVTFSRNRDPYSVSPWNYPPLAYLLFYCLGVMMPGSATLKASVLRNTSAGLLVFMLFTVFTYLVLYCILHRAICAKQLEKLLVMVTVFFSAGCIHQIERGNIIFLTLLLLAFFVFFYQSENKYVRELALICLAFAAGLKLFPALLGVLLLKEKRWKDASHCVFYGLCAFILPFFWFGGLGNFPKLLQITSYLNGLYDTLGPGPWIDLSNTVQLIFAALGSDAPYLTIARLGNLVATGAAALLLLGAFVQLSRWKTVLSLLLVSVCAAPICWPYNLIYLTVPLIMFLFGGEPRKNTDWLYLGCFLATALPLPYGTPQRMTSYEPYAEYLNVPVATWIQSFALAILIILLTVTAGCIIWKKISHCRTQSYFAKPLENI